METLYSGRRGMAGYTLLVGLAAIRMKQSLSSVDRNFLRPRSKWGDREIRWLMGATDVS